MGGENQDLKVNTFVSKLPLLEHVTHIVKGLLDKFNKEGGWNIANRKKNYQVLRQVCFFRLLAANHTKRPQQTSGPE